MDKILYIRQFGTLQSTSKYANEIVLIPIARRV